MASQSLFHGGHVDMYSRHRNPICHVLIQRLLTRKIIYKSKEKGISVSHQPMDNEMEI